MRKKDTKMHDGVTLEMGRRNAAWLRQAYESPKHCARDLDVSPHTAKKWWAGFLPENKHLAALAAKFGKRYVALIWEPAVGPWRSYAMLEELEEMESRLARMRADLEDEDERGRLAIARRRAEKSDGRGRLVSPDAEEADPVDTAASDREAVP